MSKIIRKKTLEIWKSLTFTLNVSESETEQSSHLLVLYQGVDHLQDGALWLLSEKKKKQVQLSYCRWKKSG